MSLFDAIKKVHIVGAGGIGISALAKILEAQGISVSGSDIEFGVHRAENLPSDAQLLIYSNAIPDTNPERQKARESEINQLSYPEALGEFAKGKKVIAVAGTNGKTTTTAMIGWIMEQAGLDPTVIVGSRVLDWNSNARSGKGEWLVIEADEYKRAFLNYEPDIAIITNIAEDHLDYYKDINDIKAAFRQFVRKIKPDGRLVYNSQDKNTASVISDLSRSDPGRTTLPMPGEGIEDWHLQVPGKFNQENAAAAAAVAKLLKIDDQIVKHALESFSGTWRRFERVGKLGNAEIISDYAHHPDGIRVTLAAAAESYPGQKILVVFQPHQHNRTKKLFNQFVAALCGSDIDHLIIAEIFDVAGREAQPDQDIRSRDLVREIKKCGKQAEYVPDLADCENKIRAGAGNYDMILIMGAGDIYKVANNLVK